MGRRKQRVLFRELILFTVAASSLFAAGTKIVHRWVLSGPMPKLQNILVVAALDNYLIRQEFEDEMERLLAKSGVHGIRGHMVLPSRNELMEGELRQIIKKSDFDGVLVIRPKDIRNETEELVSSPYAPPAGYYRLWPYWSSYAQTYRSTSYSNERTIVRAEFNLYDSKTEQLLWNGETDTLYSKDFQKRGREYARALTKQLQKDRTIGDR